ncbi:MAG TPA: FtsX-like permease family protein [Actinomycetota bacterium]|nr:FtsX-like permease family protein [Actinomycetota bacterium]
MRWAWRLFRREWRQQILMLGLLTLAAAAALFCVSAAYNVVPSSGARFGTATQRLTVDGADPRKLEADIAAIRAWFGTVELIGHRQVAIPGSVETLELRAQDPRGTYSAPMLALQEGRWPTTASEVALTDAAAATFQVRVGSRLHLDGRDRSVVGLVENPRDLGDEFAVVAPRHADPPRSVTILARASRQRAAALPATVQAQWESRPQCHATLLCLTPGQSEQATAAAGMLGVTTVALLLVSLIAAAGFVVVAQRRLRQLGMLAAVGATERHLRLVLLANGAVVAAIAAVIGTAIALVGWIAVAPALETATGHRIDRFDLPWWLIGAGMLLAVVTATAAAWWPARTVARIPVTQALSARPPRPKPAHRTGLAAGLLVTASVVCLAAGIDADRDRVNPPLVIIGTVTMVLGILLVGPLAIRVLAAAGARAPVAVRLALRDLSRHQARSGAALAAISLGLAIPVAVVVAASAAEYTADEGNLPDRQVVIRVGDAEPLIPERTPAQLGTLDARVNRIAATLGNAAVIALDAAVNPADREGRDGQVLRPAVVVGGQVDESTVRDLGILYVATPELLGHVGIDPTSVRPGTNVLTVHPGDLRYANVSNGGNQPIQGVQVVDLPAYSSSPTSFITPAGLRRAGWRPTRAGWLIETSQPLTSAQLAAARDLAADAGITIEARNNQDELPAIRTGATAAGLLLALGILAMTIGLIRGEAAGDLRTLSATGATGRTRRTLAAATSGALALLGALLGTGGAYLALTAGYDDDLGSLSQVPLPQLTIILAGLPLAAATGGWLLAGRQPPTLTRQLLE